MNLRTIKTIMKSSVMKAFSQEPYNENTRLVIFPWGVQTVEVPMWEKRVIIHKGEPIGPMHWQISPYGKDRYMQSSWIHPCREAVDIFAKDPTGEYYHFGTGEFIVFRKTKGMSFHSMEVNIAPDTQFARQDVDLSDVYGLIAVLNTHDAGVRPSTRRDRYAWRFRSLPDRTIRFNVTPKGYNWILTPKPVGKKKWRLRRVSNSMREMIDVTTTLDMDRLEQIASSTEPFTD